MIRLLLVGQQIKYMKEKEIENYKQRDVIDIFHPPPPEPIYDLTSSDKTKLVKAAGPVERGENL